MTTIPPFCQAPTCGLPLTRESGRRSDAIYCSKQCGVRAWNWKKRRKTWAPTFNPNAPPPTQRRASGGAPPGREWLSPARVTSQILQSLGRDTGPSGETPDYAFPGLISESPIGRSR